MTREDAIEKLELMRQKVDEKTYRALILAIKALEQNESAEKWYKLFVKKLDEQEPCDDAISREELLKAIDTWDKFGVDDTNSLFRLDNLSLPHYVPYIHYDDVIKCIKGMPSVTHKSGKWIDKDLRKEEYVLASKCSVCGQVRVIDKFCSNCGACMKDGRTLDEFIKEQTE